MNQGVLQRLVFFLATCLIVAASGHAGTGSDSAPVTQPLAGSQAAREIGDKMVVGETARITVAEAGLEFPARIDTGARVTSIHAPDIQVAGGAENHRANKGKPVTFRIINADGGERVLESTIVDVSSVRNAQGTEYRYVVELTLVWEGFEKRVQVNLRDRGAMTYKLLIGRNWLADDFLVDVDRGKPEE